MHVLVHILMHGLLLCMDDCTFAITAGVTRQIDVLTWVDLCRVPVLGLVCGCTACQITCEACGGPAQQHGPRNCEVEESG